MPFGRLLDLCAHVAAELPYLKADEPYLVVYHINSVISTQAASVAATFKAFLHGRGDSTTTSPLDASHSEQVSCPCLGTL